MGFKMRVSDIKTLTNFYYEGDCVNTEYFEDDATLMSNTIDNSDLLKPEYLEMTDIPSIAPTVLKNHLTSSEKFVMGYYRDLLWIYFSHVDIHYFFTADRSLNIPAMYHETAELDRGN
jgi:hypothetical protein